MSRIGTVTVSMVMQIMGIVMLVLILLYYMVSAVTVPVWNAQGEVQARLLSLQVANNINALSTMEAGSIEKEFEGRWDVELYKKSGIICSLPFASDCGWYVKFSDGDHEGETRIVGDLPLEENKLLDRSMILIEKGDQITLS